MKQIWKITLKTTDEQILEIPESAKILTVQVQHEKPCLWVLVNTESKNELRKIRIIGTGNAIEDEFIGDYIGTYQLFNGDLVFHVFDCV